MYSDPIIDPMGSLVVELRADADVADVVDTRVGGFEPKTGWARGPKEYQAFIVLSMLDAPPHPRVPMTFADVGVRCYGVTAQGAWDVWARVVKAMHQVGPRIKANGLGIYKTIVVTGGAQDRDPDTKQPVVTGTIRLIATTQAVAV